MSVDPYWNHVAALLYLETDPAVEEKGKTVVMTGTADAITVDGSQTLFGDDTLHFVGEANDAGGVSGSTIRVDLGAQADAATFNFGSGDFTIEIWALADTSMPKSTTIDAFMPYPMMERSNASFNSGCWSLHDAVYNKVIGGSETRKPAFEFWHADYSTTAPMLDGGFGSGDKEGQWTHFAVTRQGNQWTLWIQGVATATRTSTLTSGEPSAHLRIGNSIFHTDSVGGSGSQGRAWTGNLAECRVTKGFARYTVNFEDAFTDGVGPGARFPNEWDSGDYSGSTFTGPQGAAATGDRIDGLPGPDGEGTSLGVTLTLPSPPPTYNQQNEAETRRAIENAVRIAAQG